MLVESMHAKMAILVTIVADGQSRKAEIEMLAITYACAVLGLDGRIIRFALEIANSCLTGE